MTIADLIQNVIDSSKERIKNPIVGAFICSFLIFNWRPISILFSSNLPIQCRIATINDEYCTKWALIIPITVAFIYTLIIPVIMIAVDYCLMPIKRVRIANIYKNKGFTTDQKIVHAEKQFQLKNAESGNKDRQALLDQIKNLEDAKIQIEETNSFIVANLNQKLEEANKSFNESLDQKNQRISDLTHSYDLEKRNFSKYKTFFAIMANLDQYDLDAIRELGSSLITLVGASKINDDSLKILREMSIINQKGKTYELTSLGKELYTAIIEIGIE